MTGDGAAPVPDSARGEAARPRDAGGGARDSIVPALYVDSSTVSFPPGRPGPGTEFCAADSAHDAYLRELSRAVSARPTDPDREVTLSLRMRPRSTSRHFEATTMTQCASSRSQQT